MQDKQSPPTSRLAPSQGLSSATGLVSHALASGFDATKINTPPLQKEVSNLGQLLDGSLSRACNVASLKS